MFHTASSRRTGWGICPNDNTERSGNISQNCRDNNKWDSKTDRNNTGQITCHGKDTQITQDIEYTVIDNGLQRKTVYPNISHTLIARMTTKTGNTQDKLVVVEKYENK